MPAATVERSRVPTAAPDPARRPELASLTGLRFFAAAAVLVYHFRLYGRIPAISAQMDFGRLGVSLFFVLSGFVLYWSRPPYDTPGRFYWRRFARIWPLHVVCTIPCLWVYYSMQDRPVDWPAALLTLLLVQAWIPSPSWSLAGNPASWSLSCEAFFYAVYPVVQRMADGLRRHVWTVLLLCFGTGMVAVAAISERSLDLHGHLWLSYFNPAFRLGEFVLGVVLGRAVAHGWRPRPSSVTLWAAIAVAWVWFRADWAGSLSGTAVPELAERFEVVVVPLVFGMLISSAATADLTDRPSVLRLPPLVLLGRWSYAMYLTHATLVYVLIEERGRQPPSDAHALALGMFAIVGILVAGAVYTWVERPLERRLRRMHAR